jgi:hypothetical protein
MEFRPENRSLLVDGQVVNTEKAEYSSMKTDSHSRVFADIFRALVNQISIGVVLGFF